MRSAATAALLGALLLTSGRMSAIPSTLVIGVAGDRPKDASRLKIAIGELVSYKISLQPFDREIVLRDPYTHRNVSYFLAEDGTTIDGVPFTCTGKWIARDIEPYGSFESIKFWCAAFPHPRGTKIALLYWDEPGMPPHLTSDSVVTLRGAIGSEPPTR